jgi:hypothetical protein
MRLPARALAGHLVWSRDGSAWAVWRVDAVCYPYLRAAEKLRWHAAVRAALMALPPESLLLSVCARVDPGAVVARMIDGVALDERPAWRAEAAAALEDLCEVAVYERRGYLVARLPDAGMRRVLSSALAAARSSLGQRLALPAAPLSPGEVAARRRQAELLEARLTPALRLRRVAAGEVRWLYARALRRGVADPYPDDGWTAEATEATEIGGDTGHGPSLAALADATFYEGGARDDPDRPAHRRYLRVDTEAGTGYLTLACVAEMPREFTFPGGAGEWFRHLDQLPFPVDWCARVTAVANAEAQARARRQARQLAGQFDEYDGEITGAPAELAEAVAGVDAERAELAANSGEPELQTTVVLGLAAGSLPTLEGRFEQLAALFTPADYALGRPTGGQLALLGGMLPGSALPPVARDYTQYLLSRDLAAGAPFAGANVGDPGGLLLGVSLDVGGVDPASGQAMVAPVLFDPARGPRVNRSGSVGVAGNLGSGKSYFAKRCMHAVLARGGQVVALDRTALGEYVAFAGVAPGRAQVVRLTADSKVCLDPLRVFAGEDRISATVGFATLLTQLSPAGLEGAALAEAVRVVAARPDGRLGDVLAELDAAGHNDPDARAVARKLAVHAHSRLAGLAFDEGDRQLLRLDADYIVFHTPGLALPRREELLSEHLARQLLPEQLFSQALLYLVAAVARAVIFSDPGRFGLFACDESWALTASPQGQQLVLDAIRDGRKHNAAVWLLSQHADDLGDDQLAHLLGSRFVFRQDPGAAPAAARLLGADPSEVAGPLTQFDAGQCLYRDSAGRIGRIQVLAARGGLHEAFDTTPAASPINTTAPAPADEPAARDDMRADDDQAADREDGGDNAVAEVRLG